MSPAADSYSSKRAAALAGVTYRRLDYWARTGVLPDTADGSGSLRCWSPVEVLLMAMVNEAQTAANGSTSCLDAFRAHRDHVLGMLRRGARRVAMIDGQFVDVSQTGALTDSGLRGFGAASWTVIDVDVLRERVDSRRLVAASMALSTT